MTDTEVTGYRTSQERRKSVPPKLMTSGEPMSEQISPFDPFFEKIREIVREEIKAAATEKPVKLLYTTREAAGMLKVEESWLATRARAGLVPFRMLGHYRRFAREDVDAVKSSLDECVERIEADEPIKTVEPPPSSTVKTYFIYSSLRNAVKIGRSKDPKRRLSSLRSGAGEELIILTLIDGDCEKELQQRFNHLCRIGEWFDYASEIRDFLAGTLTAHRD
jgi:hypothetical protein